MVGRAREPSKGYTGPAKAGHYRNTVIRLVVRNTVIRLVLRNTVVRLILGASVVSGFSRTR